MSADFITTVDMLGKVFWVCALAGTLFFVLRVIMMFAGGHWDDSIDHGGVHVDSTDAAFEVFSINTITAFIMMFGWVGLTCHVQYALSPMKSIIIAFLAGALAMLLTAWLFRMASKLVDKGETFKIEETVGKTAQVYQKIPADGRGKINLTMTGGMTREVEAVSSEKVEIASFQTVKVVAVVDSQTVSVKKV